jgi:glucose-1-phosphate adenylyltransferase
VNTLALIVATEQGKHLSLLSQNRPKSAIPFAGKYRLIDFALSNCVNSGIFDIGILTQYWIHTLEEHIRTGRPWGLDRHLSGGVTLLPPYQHGGGTRDWYRSTGDAIYQNLDFILAHKADTILILPGDQVCQIDYNPVLRYHQEQQADLTICATPRPYAPLPHRTVLITARDGRVLGLQEGLSASGNDLVSMHTYVIRADVLVQCLVQNAHQIDDAHDLGRDLLSLMLAQGTRLYGYRFDGYWAEVDTVPAYWEASMALLQPDSSPHLLGPDWEIHTRSEERVPAAIHTGAMVSNSLITDGCIIDGRVENSVLFPGVRVGAGAQVRYSVVFDDCEIGPRAVVERAILDKRVVVGENGVIRFNPAAPAERSPVIDFEGGIVVVGKDAHLPASCVLGHCRAPHGDE